MVVYPTSVQVRRSVPLVYTPTLSPDVHAIALAISLCRKHASAPVPHRSTVRPYPTVPKLNTVGPSYRRVKVVLSDKLFALS